MVFAQLIGVTNPRPVASAGKPTIDKTLPFLVLTLLGARYRGHKHRGGFLTQDKFGRRPLLLVGSALLGACMLSIAVNTTITPVQSGAAGIACVALRESPNNRPTQLYH